MKLKHIGFFKQFVLLPVNKDQVEIKYKLLTNIFAQMGTFFLFIYI